MRLTTKILPPKRTPKIFVRGDVRGCFWSLGSSEDDVTHWYAGRILGQLTSFYNVRGDLRRNLDLRDTLTYFLGPRVVLVRGDVRIMLGQNPRCGWR